MAGRRRKAPTSSWAPQRAQNHVLPSISSSPARTVTPLVQGWEGVWVPTAQAVPTPAQRQAVGELEGGRGAGGRADGDGHNLIRSLRQEQS